MDALGCPPHRRRRPVRGNRRGSGHCGGSEQMAWGGNVFDRERPTTGRGGLDQGGLRSRNAACDQGANPSFGIRPFSGDTGGHDLPCGRRAGHEPRRYRVRRRCSRRGSVDFRLDYGPLNLGNGRYTISIALYRHLSHVVPSEMYDLLDRSYEFEVQGNKPFDNGVFSYERAWNVSATALPQEAETTRT